MAYTEFDQQFIGGRWRAGRGQGRIRDINPFNDEILTEIPHATVDDVDEAYAAARKAQRPWWENLPAQRAAVMRAAAGVMTLRRDEIISWLIRESGSTRLKAAMEWAAAHAVLLQAAGDPYLLTGRILPADVPGKEARVYRKPAGVVGIISPWNWPLQLSMRSLAPALAIGNAVVLKPASDTPVTGGLLLAKLFEEAGLPAGVLNVVCGASKEIGDVVVQHDDARVISFTGSTPVGRRIAGLAVQARIIKRVELELGGNSPFVVLEDAPLEDCVESALAGKFLHQGQICMITNRLIVTAPVYDAFCARFAAGARDLPCGDPDDAQTVIGPIINDQQLESLQQRITQARGLQIRELAGGAAHGRVLPPHVFANVTNDSPLAANELFGPIAPIIRAEDADEALRLANATEYGLSSAVWSGDLERGVRFARQIEAGMAHVNDHPVNDLPNNPFGGEKNSGIGRFGGEWAVRAFASEQWVTVQHAKRPLPKSAHALDPSAGGPPQ